MINFAAVLAVALATHEVGFPGAVVSGADPNFAAVPSPAAAVERVGVPVMFSRQCGLAVSGEAPVLTLVSETAPAGGPLFEYELRYRLVVHELAPGEDPWICPSTSPLPPASFLIDVGPLPEGTHRFRAMAIFDGEVAETSTSTVSVSGVPSTGVSGAWYAPEQSGRGLFVARISAQAGDPAPLLALYWATHDAGGQPVWVVAPAPADGPVVEAEAFNSAGAALAPGTADLQTQRWGTLRFEYTGCGQAILSWNADDAAVTDGSMEIEQLAEPDGLATCRIERFRHHPEAAVRQ